MQKSILKLDSNRNVKAFPNLKISLLNDPLVKTDQGELLVYDRRKKDCFSFDKMEYKGYQSIPKGVMSNQTNGSKHTFYNIKNSTLFNLSNDSVQNEIEIRDDIRKIYRLKNKHLWIPLEKNGIYAFDENLNPLFQNRVLYKDHFISAVFQDQENNIWLGTFNNGLLFIPNTNLLTIRSDKQKDNYAVVNTLDNKNFLIGTYNGAIYSIDETLNTKKIYQNEIKSDLTFPLEGSPYFITQSKSNSMILKNRLKDASIHRTLLSACKKVIPLGERKYIIISQLWVSLLELHPDSDEFNRNPIRTQKRLLKLYRSTTGIVDSTQQYLYICNGKGVVRYDLEKLLNSTILKGIPNIPKNTYQKHFLYKENNFVATSIAPLHDGFAIGTLNHGVLFLQNDSIVPYSQLNSSLNSLVIKKIKYQNNQLYISTDSSFEIWDLHNNSMQKLNSAEGITNSTVRDFALTNKLLCLITPNGLQVIELDNIKSDKSLPKQYSIQTLVNGTPVSLQEHQEFKSHENHLLFSVFAPSFLLKDLIQYKYRLSGVDKKWQYQQFSENEIEYKSLPPGEYLFELSLVADNKEQVLTPIQFSILPPIWLRPWFITLSSLFFLGLVFIIYKIALKKQSQKTEREKQLVQFKLRAIQSQMNPHFIFNALNSIQDFVLQGDIENSYDYINDFSDLTRKTLSYSNLDFIDLKEEIEVLQLYLTLEQLRFKKDFSFTMDNRVTQSIKLPPMIIQPFVENAIVHGLFHSENSKKLNITFEYKEHLICTIKDNGIGRKKAEEILKRQRRKHESFSSKAIRNRLNIFNELYKKDFKIVYNDLYKDSEPIGTEVVLTIPVKNNP